MFGKNSLGSPKETRSANNFKFYLTNCHVVGISVFMDTMGE